MQPLFVAELMMLSACAHAGASDVETACCGEVHELKLQCVKPRHCGPRKIQVHLVLVRLAAKQHQHWIFAFPANSWLVALQDVCVRFEAACCSSTSLGSSRSGSCSTSVVERL